MIKHKHLGLPLQSQYAFALLLSKQWMMWEEKEITVVTDGYVVTVYLKDTDKYLKSTHKFGMALVDILFVWFLFKS